ncbi:MAG: type IV toxin-antitoxin system AbiEi family antitoxin domain-containing protein [Lachnospiraceae bacterium]|jgi:predicted transcriptional regulator of viral defense system|nr:type IV toxin-antitoxin system AbiEi family antitoxin domain-containing protein [Lachnospiraceae bacterium]MCH4031654.1 type IV toxin-antitoxin system AbiEi family antitoxin domain-containing protein [Lachnospiraceae bacterium]MCH4071137.1 type IV toxin-antitoxin system AbiEi family antitoxin domain-containing protein [Lachnospiraceae bacterium]MCH4108208.1 type IV toxin-antitoxin system AbiEi family antitoxin domain-containing protein [Lachnospiraceae bacterium]MCI1362305.1 type IV toxin-an
MTNYDKIIEICKDHHGIVRTQDLSQENIPRWYLTDLVNKGKLFRIERGIYTTDEGDIDDYYFFQLRNKRCIYSYLSALYIHEMTDRVPYQKEVTVYSGYNSSRVGKDVLVHYISKDKYRIGITDGVTLFGNPVKVYDVERTVCDLIASRNKIDSEIFADAMHRFSRRKDHDYKKLREYAKVFGISREVADILEVL